MAVASTTRRHVADLEGVPVPNMATVSGLRLTAHLLQGASRLDDHVGKGVCERCRALLREALRDPMKGTLKGWDWRKHCDCS